MARFDHLLKSYDVPDLLDEIASADPPAYLRRCFAEGISAPRLSFTRVQQLAACAMVLDAVLNDRAYEELEPELMADWRVHFGRGMAPLKDTALTALQRAQGSLRPTDPQSAAELDDIERQLAGSPAPVSHE